MKKKPDNAVNRTEKTRKSVSSTRVRLLMVLAMFGLIFLIAVFYYLSGGEVAPDEGIDTIQPIPEDESMSFEFNLTSDSKHIVTLKPGDTFKVVYRLYRTDKDEDFNLYAVQNEIEYDPSVFVLDTETISSRFKTSIHSVSDNANRIFMNMFSAVDAGFDYKQGDVFGSFVLKVREDALPGSYDITSNNCRMSNYDGTASYKCTVNDLTIEIVDQ